MGNDKNTEDSLNGPRKGEIGNRAFAVLFIFLMLFPFVFTLLYFQVFSKYGGTWMQAAYGVGKTLQFSFPVFWIAIVCKEKWRIRAFRKTGFLEGIVFGSVIFFAMMLLYHFLFGLPGNLIGPDSEGADMIKERIGKLRFNTPVMFVLLGFFYCIIHSGLEEYYWRWFVFGYGSRKLDWRLALFLSSLGFTFHHIVILCNFFGYDDPWAWFFSFCVGVGGAYWCWLYRRSDSIWAPWISHAIIDAAIFAIGFSVLF